jgi:hypothetical protein
MIIRASLGSLWSDQVTPAERREALADIDEETRRLNRIVTEVLDFSKPIRFELGETQINHLCRSSSAAAWERHRWGSSRTYAGRCRRCNQPSVMSSSPGRRRSESTGRP